MAVRPPRPYLVRINHASARHMTDKLDTLDDAAAAAAFRRLVRHLRHRSDAQNVDLMGLAGFCRNCLGDWVAEATGMAQAEARETVYGMPQSEWKTHHQKEATPRAARPHGGKHEAQRGAR